MKGRKHLLLAIMLLEWIALLIQLVLHFQNTTEEILEATLRFFSFYTILTNILVAVMVTTIYFSKNDGKSLGFYYRPSIQTSITMHITIVGLIYNLLLRGLWWNGGLQSIIHDVLHSVLPLLTILYWWCYTDARRVKYTDIFIWLVYPFIYTIYTFLRGTYVKWYPYPFMNVDEFGYTQVIKNCGFVALTFVFFSLLFVFLGRLKRINVF
ncbi:MAG: hypothetical protein EOO92_00130 [Pedobacter sp.]|nr:MAG: hypothetical protein EOO92_00130 [Pedobacter sp.]